MAHLIGAALLALASKPVVVEPARHGFAWADAAVGAAAALGCVLVVAGVLVLRRERNGTDEITNA